MQMVQPWSLMEAHTFEVPTRSRSRGEGDRKRDDLTIGSK